VTKMIDSTITKEQQQLLALGGGAGSLVNAAILIEESFRVEPSIALAIMGTGTGTGLGLTPFVIGTGEEQRDRLLPQFLSQEGTPMASFVPTKLEGTANWLEKGGKGLGTTAIKDGDS
jgi:nitroalkane oxidase